MAPNSSNVYNYADNNVTAGSVYAYRLKMRDIDGRYTYSFVITVRYAGKSASGYSIHPNPVSGSYLYLRSPAGNNTGVQASIINLAGKTIYNSLLTTSDMSNGYFKIPVKQLPAGSYLLQVSGNNGERPQVIKFITGN